MAVSGVYFTIVAVLTVVGLADAVPKVSTTVVVLAARVMASVELGKVMAAPET
jgi:hypothetical protein